MRLLKLGIYYRTYLHDFYQSHPELSNLPYSIQHKLLIEDCYGSSDFWTTELTKLNYQTTDIIANAEFLQLAWAKENGIAFGDNWIFEISSAQIKKFQPDILLVADYSTFTAEFLSHVRIECPSIKMIIGWCGAPYGDSTVFKEWDVILSCIPELVANFNNQGHQCFHINHAFAPVILDRIDLNAPPRFDFTFVGSIFKQNDFHLEREKILLDLLAQTDLQIRSEITQPSTGQKRNNYLKKKAYSTVSAVRDAGVPQSVLNKIPVIKKIASWNKAPELSQFVDPRIAGRTKKPLFGLQMFQHLRESRTVLNTHIDISPVSASNMRLFETTGVATCLLTDWKENLPDLFEPDVEVLTYKSTEECIEKVKYIIDHEEERLKIAQAGQKRTLRQHTFRDRAVEIDNIIKKFI